MLVRKLERERAKVGKLEQLLEDKTRESYLAQDFIRRVLDSMLNMLFVIDADGKILDVNHRVESTLGYTEKSLIGTDLASLLKRDASSNKGLGEVYLVKSKNGEPIPVWSARSQVEQGPFDDKSIVVILQDIRDLVATQAALEEQRASSLYASKMASLGEMAGGIAHEVNTPLGAILMAAEQVQSELAEPNADRALMDKMLTAIKETVGKVSKIIEGLRTFSRDSNEEDVEKVTVVRLVESTLELCGDRFRRHGIEVKVSVPEALTLEVRPVELNQVLINLLNNAIDAIETDSEPGKENWVHIQATDSGEQVELVISNSGPPIEPEVAQRVFEPFFTTKGVGKGTGIGLSVSLGIVQGHGGSLSVGTQENHTAFYLHLNKHYLIKAAA